MIVVARWISQDQDPTLLCILEMQHHQASLWGSCHNEVTLWNETETFPDRYFIFTFCFPPLPHLVFFLCDRRNTALQLFGVHVFVRMYVYIFVRMYVYVCMCVCMFVYVSCALFCI